MKKLLKLVHELETKIPFHEKKNVDVSISSVGWQIEHSFKVIYNVIEALKKSNPAEYRRNFNLKLSIILITKNIPRGVGKAPKVVQPIEEPSKVTLDHILKTVLEKVNELEKIAANSYFKHPTFGNLNKKTAIRFLEVHTLHHLKIINDICR
jgi:hypothetical protein